MLELGLLRLPKFFKHSHQNLCKGYHKFKKRLGRVEQLVRRPTKESEVLGSIPTMAHTFVDIDHKIFSMFISTLPLI